MWSKHLFLWLDYTCEELSNILSYIKSTQFSLRFKMPHLWNSIILGSHNLKNPSKTVHIINIKCNLHSINSSYQHTHKFIQMYFFLSVEICSPRNCHKRWILTWLNITKGSFKSMCICKSTHWEERWQNANNFIWGQIADWRKLTF